MKKQGCFLTLLFSFLMLITCIPASAGIVQETSSLNKQASATVVIIDSETGNTREIKVPSKNIKITKQESEESVQSLQSTEDTYLSVASITLDSNTLFSGTDTQYSTKPGSDITLTAGMEYSLINNNAISMKRVFGSYGLHGSYCARNKYVNWANSNGECEGNYRPSNRCNSFSRATNTMLCGWHFGTLYPFVSSQCEVYVPGMSAYRTVSIQFDLSNP